jgi:tRNA(Arg) A34 adenosine deaminase TadA
VYAASSAQLVAWREGWGLSASPVLPLAINEVAPGVEVRGPFAELEVARWSASLLTADERAASTVYTCGEHCPMCSAAHAWMGLGPIVYAASSAQLVGWRTGWGLAASPVLPLAINEIAPGVEVRGPFAELEDELRALHQRQAERSRLD